MKKITAFFLLLLPIFITGLMFISGLIININYQVSVVGVSISEHDHDTKWDIDHPEQTSQTFKLSAHVIPLNAKNKNIIWTSSDESVATVNSEGLVTVKDYGKVMITATAAGNQNCRACCELDSYDTVVHSVYLNNSYDIGYLSPGSMAKPQIITKPTIDHAANVESIEYSFDGEEPKGLSIDKNTGIIKVDDNATDTSAKVKVTVKTNDGIEGAGKRTYEKSNDPAPITVGPAVDVLSFDDNTDQTITSDTYNLYEHMNIAPAVKNINLTVKDFIFASENINVATVENYDSTKQTTPGKVTFLKADEYVTFTATYRRNPDLKISKKLKSTSNNLVQVYFNQSSITIPFDQQRPIASTELDWVTYPQKETIDPKSFAYVDFESTDETVVSTKTTVEGNKVPFIEGPGKCALKIFVGDKDKNNIKSDVCEVNITMPSNNTKWFKDIAVTLNNTYYYPIRNNLNQSQSSVDANEYSWTISDESVASIDKDLILFKKPGTITVTEYNSGASFTLECKESSISKDISETINIEVGQRTKLNNATAKFEDKYYKDYFDVDNEYFIPKRGCDISDFELNDGRKVRLIVKQDPLYITTDKSAVYSTPDEQVDFLNTFNPTVYPSSAIKSSGTIYEPIFNYSFDDKSTGTIDENVINFNKIGTCDVSVSYGYIDDDESKGKITSSYLVRSTYNDGIGKFTVTKDDAFFPSRRTVMKQYDKWNVSDTLRIDDVTYRLYEGLQIKSMNGLCNPTLDWVGLMLSGHIELKANPITGRYGSDIIEISSPTYSLFLNVEINSVITDFTVTYSNDIWVSDAAPTSYIETLNNIRVTPNTASGSNYPDWSYKLNDGTITDGSDGQINSLKLTEGQNTLTLYAGKANDSPTPVKQYKIEYKKTDPKWSLYGDLDGIYASCNTNSKSVMLVADGYVSNDHYKAFQEKSTISGEGLLKSFNNNIITISGINENTENAKFTLSNGTFSKQYPIGKDTISKIKLEGHNLYDQSDKKGMQKVHVYGNYTWYNGKLENYYKVPVRIWDNHRSEIKDKNKKIKALKDLKITVGRHSTPEINEEDNGDYIRVHLDSHDLYSPQEIYNNAFDTKKGKNIDFSVATKSNEIRADYRFVAVEGVNCYNAEPIYYMSNERENGRKTLPIVLQKNFGVLDYDTEENAVLNNCQLINIPGLYGNGYSLDFKYISRQKVLQRSEKYAPIFDFCLNADVRGGDSETLLSKKEQVYLQNSSINGYDSDRYYAYSSFHDFTHGITTHVDKKNINMKNMVFYNYIAECININTITSDPRPNSVKIEDSSFFNSGSFPLYVIGECPLYFKGDIGIYNFLGKEMLRNIKPGTDLTSLWPALLSFARANNMVHKDFKGDEIVNSFMLVALNPSIYFWDSSINDWVKSDRGIAGSAKYLAKYGEIGIPFIAASKASLWGGTNPSFEPGAPGYYDEYDSEGKIKLTFVNDQIVKWTRHPKYF